MKEKNADARAPQKKPRKGMSLRAKAMLLLALAFFVQLVALSIISENILITQLDKHEANMVRLDTTRALNAIDDRVFALKRTVEDWAIWDDTYYFVEGEQGGYVESNLPDSTFTTLRLNFLLFYNSSGQVVGNRSFDLESESQVPTSPGLLEYISTHPQILNASDPNNAIEGLILLPEGPAYISSRSIVRSSGEGPAAGTIIMGRYIDDEEISSISETTRLSVTLCTLDDLRIPEVLRDKIPLLNASEVATFPVSEDVIAGYAVIEDVFGNKLLVLIVEEDRTVHREGLQAAKYLMGSVLAVVILFAVITALLVENTILARFNRLGKEFARIGSAKDPSARVAVEGSDELAALASSVNEMLAQFETSQKELREAEEKYESLVEKTTDGVLIVQDATFKFANQTAANLVGYERKELIGKNMLDIVAPEDKQMVLDNSIARLSGKPAPPSYQVAILRKDGSRFPIELTATIIQYKGRPAVLVTARDITLRLKDERAKREYTRKLESEVKSRTKQLVEEKKKVEELSDLKDKFVKDAGHELQGPLSVILTNLKLLKSIAPIGKEKEWYTNIEMLERNAARLSNSVEMMLEFVVLGGAGIKQERVYLRELLKEIHNEYLPAAKAKGLKLELEAEQYVLKGDAALLKTAIGHLVSNAIKFTKKGGVKIKAVPSQNSVSISVSDTGVGISQKDQKRLFERFFKVDPSAPGMGVGLSVAKEIINKHKGKISIRSAPGRGTAFEVVLPRGVKE